MQRQLIEIEQNHASELETMQQLKCKLEQLIRRTKDQEKQQLIQERETVAQLGQNFKELDKKHKQLAEEYFSGRRKQKQAQEELQR